MNKNDRPLATLDKNPLVSYFKVEDNEPDCDQEHREDAREVRKLLALQRAGAIRLMVAVSTMLENPRSGKAVDLSARLKDLGFEPDDISAHPRPIAFATKDAPGAMTYDTNLDYWFNAVIHATLFEDKPAPGRDVHFRWYDYRDSECERLGITGSERYALAKLDYLRMHPHWTPTPLQQRLGDPHGKALDELTAARRAQLEDILTKTHRKWTNAKCDALNLVTHISHALQTSVPQHALFVTRDKDFRKAAREPATWARLTALGFPGRILKPEEAAEHFQKVTGVSLPDTD
jgi:hypothetical protein